MLKLALFSLFAAFIWLSNCADEKVCPKVDPVCDCVPVDYCTSDKNCKGGQKCCLDCCGGHQCTDPVDKSECKDPNAEYQTCGTSCPPTCKDPTPGPCIEMCVSGCFCKEGYLESTNGSCVPAGKC